METRQIAKREIKKEFIDEEDIVDIATKRANEELLAFVDKQIQRLNNKVSLLSNGGNITLNEVEIALATYEPTLFALIAIYEQAKADAAIAKAKYEEFYSEKYMEVRNQYNTKDVKNAQWLSAKEIESTAYVLYKKEFADLKAEIIKTDGQRSTVERLLRSWENYQFILTTISKNIIAQMSGSHISVDLERD